MTEDARQILSDGERDDDTPALVPPEHGFVLFVGPKPLRRAIEVEHFLVPAWPVWEGTAIHAAQIGRTGTHSRGGASRRAQRLADLGRTTERCTWLALDERDTAVESIIGALEATDSSDPRRVSQLRALPATTLIEPVMPNLLRSPSSPPTFVFRPVRTRMIEALEVTEDRSKLISVIAPIGYGKTVLLSELCTHIGAVEHCCWVELDDRDNRVDRVIRALEASFSTRTGGFRPMRSLIRGDIPLQSQIDELIEIISHLPAPTTIFIDSLNSCTDGALGALCDALIFRTPNSLRLVWSSTSEVPFNLGRAKLAGLVRQVGIAELSLNATEARELLGAKLESRIGAMGVRAILQQTEGWPAAIRMVQIILSGAERPRAALESFSGSDEDVAALLNRQVLGGFATDLRDFLLCIGPLRTFTVELCRHVTGDGETERHIDFLLRRNVFIIPLDRNRRAYRLHGLFREYLLGEARRFLEPQVRLDVLRKAAEWFEKNDEWRDAIDYALEAGDTPTVVRILERTAAIFVRDQGDIGIYIAWVDNLRAANVELGWEAHFWYVWALTFHRRYETAQVQREALAERLRQAVGTAAAAPDDLPQRIDYLNICINLLMDRVDETFRCADEWLAAGDKGDPYNRASVTGLRGICLACNHRFDEARKVLLETRRIMHEVGGAYTRAWISLTYTTVGIFEGDFAQAHRAMDEGLSLAREELGEDAVMCDSLAFAGAGCAVEMGRDTEARELLRLGMRSAYSHGLVDVTASGLDAAVKLWNGGADSSIPIPRLRELAASHPTRLSLMLSCFLVRRLLRLGMVKDALAEAELIGLGADGAATDRADRMQLATPRYRDLFAMTAVDLLVATGRAKEAGALINQEYAVARAEGRFARLVELGLARMALALQAGNRRLAVKEFTFAVARAASREIVRPFRDQAAAIAVLVNDTKPSSWSFALREERAFFARICDTLPIESSVVQERLAACTADNAAPAVPTAREAELLAMLELGMSNQQIADQTGISVGTIKWHLKNLYRKLGIASRSAALARARAANLLPR